MCKEATKARFGTVTWHLPGETAETEVYLPVDRDLKPGPTEFAVAESS